MKIVKESLNEFERTGDVKRSLNIGTKTRMKNALDKADIDPENYDITTDNVIVPQREAFRYYKLQNIRNIQRDFLSEDEKDIVEMITLKERPIRVFDAGTRKGISLDKTYNLFKLFGDPKMLDAASIAYKKHTRDEETLEKEEGQNTYVFIGFTDKVPVTIDGEEYFKNKFSAETMVKIDKYDASDLQMIPMMKIRAKTQYPDGAVYMITVPEEVMDEDRYNDIPEEWHSLIKDHAIKV